MSALISFASTALGGVLFHSQAGRKSKFLELLGSDFAIGAMLAASLLSLIGSPLYAAWNAADSITMKMILLGAVLGFVASSLLKRSIAHASAVDPKKLSQILFISILAFHNLPEGIASGVAQLSDSSGLLAVIALQNVPEGFLFGSMLLAFGFSRRSALLGSIGSGAIEAAGALGATQVVAISGVSFVPLLTGAAGGAMLYVTAIELFEKLLGKSERALQAKPFAIGVLATLFLQVWA